LKSPRDLVPPLPDRVAGEMPSGALHNRVLEAVYLAVDDINDVLPPEEHLDKSLDTQLLGREARFDSLGLVSLIVNVEERVIDEFQVALILGDEQAMSQRRSPFRTLGTLVEYVETRLVEAGIA
jgi:acyl carrier protein